MVCFQGMLVGFWCKRHMCKQWVVVMLSWFCLYTVIVVCMCLSGVGVWFVCVVFVCVCWMCSVACVVVVADVFSVRCIV